MPSTDLILVVHRYPPILNQLRRALVDAGYRVVAAGNDEDAEHHLDLSTAPDLVVTPLAPYGLGQLLLELRGNPLSSDLPAVVLATEDPEERRACLRLGIPHVVQPPDDQLSALVPAERYFRNFL